MTRSHQKALSATGVQIAVPGRRREILRPFPTTTDFHRHQHTTSPSIYYPTLFYRRRRPRRLQVGHDVRSPRHLQTLPIVLAPANHSGKGETSRLENGTIPARPPRPLSWRVGESVRCRAPWFKMSLLCLRLLCRRLRTTHHPQQEQQRCSARAWRACGLITPARTVASPTVRVG